MICRYILLLLLTIFSCLSVDALVFTDTIQSRTIAPVTVVGRWTANFSMPVAVVDSVALLVNNFATPADALQRQTGIALTRDGVWATSVNVRGLSEQRLIFSVDGDRIQTSSDIAAALSTVDMNSLEKIEVVKGAASVLYGSGAMGGIVNFVSARPAYSQHAKVSGWAGSGFGTVNNLSANFVGLNVTTSQWYIAMTGSYRTAGDLQTPVSVIDGSQFNDASWGLRSGIKYNLNQELLLNYQHNRSWDTGITGVNALAAAVSARYKRVDRNQLSGEYIYTDITDYLTRLSLKAYSQNIARDVEINPAPTQTTYPLKKLRPSSDNNTYGAKLTSDWTLERRHSLIVGAEGWMRRSETLRLVVLQSADTLTTVRVEQPVANARQLDLGAFVYYNFKMVPSRWVLDAGVRADYIRTMNDSAFNPVYVYTLIRGVQKSSNIARVLLFPEGQQHEGGYALHIDLKHYLSASGSMALSLANSYRAASIDERFKYIDLGSSYPLKVGNPKLRPERGTFADFNYSFATRTLTLKADVYTHYLFDLIAEKSGIFNSRTALIERNVSRALYVGSEVEINWWINSRLFLSTNASYVYTRDVEADTPLPQIPPMAGFTALSYRVSRWFHPEVALQWAGAQREQAPGESPTPGYALLHLDVNTDPLKLFSGAAAVRLFAGVDNVLNHAYYNHLSSVRAGGVRYYEPGRNFWVKTRLLF